MRSAGARGPRCAGGWEGVGGFGVGQVVRVVVGWRVDVAGSARRGKAPGSWDGIVSASGRGPAARVVGRGLVGLGDGRDGGLGREVV